MNFSDIRCRYRSKTRTKAIAPSQGLAATRCFWSHCLFKFHKNTRAYRFNFWTLALENSRFSFKNSQTQVKNKFDWSLKWLWASSYDTPKHQVDSWRQCFGSEALAKGFKLNLPRWPNCNQINKHDHKWQASFYRLLFSCLNTADMNVEVTLNGLENSSARAGTKRWDIRCVELSTIHKD